MPEPPVWPEFVSSVSREASVLDVEGVLDVPGTYVSLFARGAAAVRAATTTPDGPLYAMVLFRREQAVRHTDDELMVEAEPFIRARFEELIGGSDSPLPSASPDTLRGCSTRPAST